jgi:hypothetical protein
MRRLVWILGLCLSLLCGGCTLPRIPVRAEMGDGVVSTMVDSHLAKYYLEQYVRGERENPEYDSIIQEVELQLESQEVSNESLQALTEIYSTDFVSLMLWRHLEQKPRNQIEEEIYADEFSQILRPSLSDSSGPNPKEKDFLFVFAPGWMYQWKPESGAAFIGPRQALVEAGMRTHLLGTDENGTIRANALKIVEDLGYIFEREENIVLVSVSKAGPEMALALTLLNGSEHAHKLKAWMNIGGALRGTPLAEFALSWPMRWFVKYFAIGGASMDGVRSLTTEALAQQADDFSPPDHLVIANLIGIPMSGDVTSLAKYGYRYLRSLGPNDGATLILDEISPDSYSIVELGLDHFFRDPQIGLKAVALARTVMRLAELKSVGRE